MDRIGAATSKPASTANATTRSTSWRRTARRARSRSDTRLISSPCTQNADAMANPLATRRVAPGNGSRRSVAVSVPGAASAADTPTQLTAEHRYSTPGVRCRRARYSR
ncbi:hypothetical protein GCM10025787_57180 [Saccharopolyspora rosea]